MMSELNNQTTVNIQEKSNLIWSVADLIRDYYKPHEYGKVILPFCVLKRFDDCLIATKDKVLETYENIKHLEVKAGFLERASGYSFYNISKYDFKKLAEDPTHIENNFRNYIMGYSENVQDILDNYEFDNEIKKLSNNGLLFLVIEAFNKPSAYMGADKITSVDMGYIFEDLIKRFSESYDEQAGAHFTSRDIIYLMTDILLSEDKDTLIEEGVAKTVYDMTMGTSQMLTCMTERLKALDAEADVRTFGQELNPETYAIAKSSALIHGGNADNMKLGNTLSDDKFKDYTFDYIISNPPFGIEWKTAKKEVEAEHALGDSGRFGVGLPKISDGQMLFDLNGIKKLKDDGKMAIIHNGSSLFTGAAESGESEIRRYMIENDWLDCIIQLSNDVFYNTGITTYIWIIQKNKPLHRQGKVQLIDASKMAEQRRKNIGNKRYDITESCREAIVKVYGDYRTKEYNFDGKVCESKIFNNEDFGFNRIQIESPLRLIYSVNDKVLNFLRDRSSIPDFLDDLRGEEDYNPPAFEIADALESIKSEKIYLSENEFMPVLLNALQKHNLSTDELIVDYLIDICSEKDSRGEIVTKGKKKQSVPDTEKRDFENVPLIEDIDSYFNREVKPYNPDAWIDKTKTKVGYEIPFTRYFYKYQPPKNSDEIAEIIAKQEASITASLKALFGEGEK